MGYQMKLSTFLADNPDLDAELDVEEGDVVTDMVTLARVVRIDRKAEDALLLAAPDHVTGILQYGIICSAKLQVEVWMTGDQPQ